MTRQQDGEETDTKMPTQTKTLSLCERSSSRAAEEEEDAAAAAAAEEEEEDIWLGV